jgi:pyruvate dehydrogenase E2 component (dihydrolipoamide acetyltransferase)
MSGERIQRVNVPVWGVQMEEGTITSWLVEEGAVLNFGDPIAEMETDKLNGVVEALVEGVLRRRIAQPGDTLPPGGLLGIVADPDVTDAEIDAFVAAQKDAPATSS